MKYCSIDLETSGLNPASCQILEFGAVIDDLENQKPLSDLPKFHAYILPRDGSHYPYSNTFVGEPYALAMNHEIIRKIANRDKYKEDKFFTDEEMVQQFAKFLQENGCVDSEGETFVAGKNYATFDSKFLERIGGWGYTVKTHRRVLDPVMLYLRKDDVEPPRLSECCRRAGINDNVTHCAVDDALMVVELIRKGLK